jgi:hypothetical protein
VPYYIFEATAGTGMAVTSNRTGAGLPKPRVGSWRFVEKIDIKPFDGPRTGASSREIVEGVAKDGYFVWPVKDPSAEPQASA